MGITDSFKRAKRAFRLKPPEIRFKEMIFEKMDQGYPHGSTIHASKEDAEHIRSLRERVMDALEAFLRESIDF